MRILFQGDSVTDAGRDKRNYHELGNGYPKYAAELIKKEFPDTDFEFINLGISGNRTSQLFDRLYHDAIALQPDIISVLIGVNDIWHAHGGDWIETTDEMFTANYRGILSRLKKQTNAKLLILSPFVLPNAPTSYLIPDLEGRLPIIRSLAAEYADAYLPLDEHFATAVKTQEDPLYYSGDGVHPNANGAEYIGKLYSETIAPLIRSLV